MSENTKIPLEQSELIVLANGSLFLRKSQMLRVGSITDLIERSAANSGLLFTDLVPQGPIYVKGNSVSLLYTLEKLELNTWWIPGTGRKATSLVPYWCQPDSESSARDTVVIKTCSWTPPKSLQLFFVVTLVCGGNKTFLDSESERRKARYKVNNCYLVLYNTRTGKYHKPPTGNTFSDGHLCMGSNPIHYEEGTWFEFADRAYRNFVDVPWSGDLLSDNPHTDKLYTADPETGIIKNLTVEETLSCCPVLSHNELNPVFEALNRSWGIGETVAV